MKITNLVLNEKSSKKSRNYFVMSLLIIFSFILLANNVSALYTSYQEFPNSYFIGQARTEEWIYVNYTIKDDFVSASWRIKYNYINMSDVNFGGINVEKNLTVPSNCSDGTTIQGRMRYSGGGGDYTIDFQCFGNNSWNGLETRSWSSSPQSPTCSGDSSSQFLDGNYATNGGYMKTIGEFVGDSNWSKCSIAGGSGTEWGIFEEGMFQSLSATPITDCRFFTGDDVGTMFSLQNNITVNGTNIKGDVNLYGDNFGCLFFDASMTNPTDIVVEGNGYSIIMQEINNTQFPVLNNGLPLNPNITINNLNIIVANPDLFQQHASDAINSAGQAEDYTINNVTVSNGINTYDAYSCPSTDWQYCIDVPIGIFDCSSLDYSGNYKFINNIQATSATAIYVTQGSINSCVLVNMNDIFIEGNGKTMNATDGGYVLLGYADAITNSTVQNLNLLNTIANDFIDNEGETILPFKVWNVSMSDGLQTSWINTNLVYNSDMHLVYFVFADMVGSSVDLYNVTGDGILSMQLLYSPPLLDTNYTFNDNTIPFLNNTCVNLTQIYGDVWLSPYFNNWAGFTNLSLYKDGVWIYSPTLGIYGANLLNGTGYYCVQDYVVPPLPPAPENRNAQIVRDISGLAPFAVLLLAVAMIFLFWNNPKASATELSLYAKVAVGVMIVLAVGAVVLLNLGGMG